MLQAAVKDTKAEFDRLNARSFEYQTLKREAEGDKKLYEELVRKIKEAGINASFQNSSIRVADTARPGLKPVFPKTWLNALLAFLFATFLGVGAAVLCDVLDNTIRDPGPGGPAAEHGRDRLAARGEGLAPPPEPDSIHGASQRARAWQRKRESSHGAGARGRA